MDNYNTEAPKKKRPFLEASISPDGKTAKDVSDLRDVLNDILDQKFEEHLRSIKDDFANLKCKSEAKQEDNSQGISNLKKNVKRLKLRINS